MSSSMWILDSGVSHHMFPYSSYIASMSLLSTIPVMTVNGTPMPLVGVCYVVTPNLSLLCLSYSKTSIESCLCRSIM